MKSMKKLLLLPILLLLAGCVFIDLPKDGPLAELVIGGKGANKIAVIGISGVITSKGRSGPLGLKSKTPITARVSEELDLISSDDRVKAVIIKINSPGGSVTTCDIIAHELKLFKEKRDIPIVAILMDVAASGGYYIAAAADKIIAHPTTITGSIGVIAFSINASGLMEKIGITDQSIKSGDFKDLGSPLREMTKEERVVLQSVIDSLYERFLDVVEEGRPALDRVELTRIADGRIYTAAQALNLKLIDEIGYMDSAVEAAKELAGIDSATLVTYSDGRSYKNNIYSGGLGALGGGPPTINLLNIDATALSEGLGLNFMYLWMP
jgi:protease-4